MHYHSEVEFNWRCRLNVTCVSYCGGQKCYCGGPAPTESAMENANYLYVDDVMFMFIFSSIQCKAVAVNIWLIATRMRYGNLPAEWYGRYTIALTNIVINLTSLTIRRHYKVG